MNNRKVSAHSVCSRYAPMSTDTRDNNIIYEFVHGSKLAGWALIGMFVFMSLGCVMFGW